MRRLRYSVAMSLDGFIADQQGGYEWIIDEPELDFPAYLAKVDTLLMGRATYEVARSTPESRALHSSQCLPTGLALLKYDVTRTRR